MPPLVKSDLIFIAPQGEISERLERIRELARPSLELWADSIVPGEPLRVSWKFNRLEGEGPRSVSARFLVDGQQVRERPGVDTSDEDHGTPQSIEEIVLPPAFYRVGRRRLDVEVRSDDDRGSVFHAHRNFAVRREPVDPQWWAWRPGAHEVAWKEAFTLNADFRNGFRFASIATLSVELCEVRDDELRLDPCDYAAIRTEARNAIAADATIPFAFPLLHDWDWLTSTTFIIDGPWLKTYGYAAYLQLTDEFGNVYGGVCSPKAYRTISVPPIKRAAGVAAMTAAADAAVTAVAAAAATAGIFTAIAGAVLWVAAAAAYAVAVAAAEEAEDPPEPDEKYREPVSLEPLSWPPWPDNPPPELQPFRDFLEPMARILALARARNTLRARMMGARLFGDESALALHRDQYARIDEDLSDGARALRRALADVQETVAGCEAFDPENLRIWLDTIARDRFPAEARAAMLDAGVTPETATAIASLVASRELTEAVRVNGLFLAPLVENLERMVHAIRSERESILAGENPCPTPTVPRDRPADDESPEPPLRRRERCCCRE